MSTVKQLENWWYIKCPRCEKRWAWFGTVAEMPLCCWCAFEAAPDDIERLDKRLRVQRGVDLINDPTFPEAQQAYDAIEAEADVVVLDRAFSAARGDWRRKAIRKRMDELQGDVEILDVSEGNQEEQKGSDNGESDTD